MISASSKFQEIMGSTLRPICTPIIELVRLNDTGSQDVVMQVWESKDISSLTMQKKIDPLGRELSHMECEWKEIYAGDLNKDNYPVMYEGVKSGMLVYVSVRQNLAFSGLWGDYASGKWGDYSSKTWGWFKQNIKSEEIKFPPMFLRSAPTYEKGIVTWTAVDALCFKSVEVANVWSYGVNPHKVANMLLYNMALIRMSVGNSNELCWYWTNTMDDIAGLYGNNTIPNEIYVNGEATEQITRYIANEYAQYIDFGTTGLKIKTYSTSPAAVTIPMSLVYGDQKITFNDPCGKYVFLTNRINESEYVTVTSVSKRDYTSISSIYSYSQDGIHFLLGVDANNIDKMQQTTEETAQTNGYSIKPGKRWHSIAIGNSIGIYEEDNNLCTHEPSGNIERIEQVKSYFGEKFVTLEQTIAPNFCVEPMDVVTMETGEKNNNAYRTRKMMVVETKFTYNGAWREEIKAHEVSA